MNRLGLALVALGWLTGCESDCAEEQEAFRDAIDQSRSCEVADDCVLASSGCLSISHLPYSNFEISREGYESSLYENARTELRECRGECGPMPAIALRGTMECQEGQCVFTLSGDTAGDDGNGGHGATSGE